LLLLAPSGRKVRISFRDFDLQGRYDKTNQCIWDVLEIRWKTIYDADPEDL